jgi:hypothetical protein
MTPLADRLKDLIAINRAIAASLDYEEVLRRVVVKTAEFTNADACLLLLAKAENRATIVAQVGLDSARARAFAAPMNG